MIVILQEEKVDSSLEFLILASDGLWDVVSNEVRNAIHFSPFTS
jgi:serine/threonine protein phosphatase PrpC